MDRSTFRLEVFKINKSVVTSLYSRLESGLMCFAPFSNYWFLKYSSSCLEQYIKIQLKSSHSLFDNDVSKVVVYVENIVSNLTEHAFLTELKNNNIITQPGTIVDFETRIARIQSFTEISRQFQEDHRRLQEQIQAPVICQQQVIPSSDVASEKQECEQLTPASKVNPVCEIDQACSIVTAPAPDRADHCNDADLTDIDSTDVKPKVHRINHEKTFHHMVCKDPIYTSAFGMNEKIFMALKKPIPMLVYYPGLDYGPFCERTGFKHTNNIQCWSEVPPKIITNDPFVIRYASIAYAIFPSKKKCSKIFPHNKTTSWYEVLKSYAMTASFFCESDESVGAILRL